MRVAYIVRWDVGRETGVIKKIRSQILAWSDQGVEARLFVLSPTEGVWPGLGDVQLETVRSKGLWERDRSCSKLLDRVRAWHPDLAYVRFGAHYRPLERFMDNVPTVVEVNTDDVAEYRLSLSWYKYWYHRLTRRRIVRRAAGIVSVTSELALAFRGVGVPVVVIANGVDLARVEPAPPGEGKGVRAVFVGSPGSVWHGVDKILVLAEELPDWQFDILGPEVQGAVPQNVTVHGQVDEKRAREVMAAADVALGTLALHRKGMDEACALKVREYLALGLPCILGHRDTDLTPPPDFVLELPNTSDNVVTNIDRIRAFGTAWKGRRVDREAVRHLDVAEKERRRLAFFEDAVGAW